MRSDLNRAETGRDARARRGPQSQCAGSLHSNRSQSLSLCLNRSAPPGCPDHTTSTAQRRAFGNTGCQRCQHEDGFQENRQRDRACHTEAFLGGESGSIYDPREHQRRCPKDAGGHSDAWERHPRGCRADTPKRPGSGPTPRRGRADETLLKSAGRALSTTTAITKPTPPRAHCQPGTVNRPFASPTHSTPPRRIATRDHALAHPLPSCHVSRQSRSGHHIGASRIGDETC